MKRIVNYILISVVSLMYSSCEDYLELLPTSGLYRAEYWKAKEDVDAVLMAAYQKLGAMNDRLFLYGELRGDMLKGETNQPDDQVSIMQSNIYPGNPLCNWQDFYKIINYCNEVIKNAPLVRDIDNTYTEFQEKRVVAEAYFLRSLTYFYLVRIFNEVPLILEPAETDGADFFLPKSTEDAILGQIVTDLKNNRAFAPSGDFSTIAENKGRASKGAFDALLADIELWRFNYNEVLVHVQKIEDSENYELLRTNDWFDLFYPGNSLESIFEIQFDQSTGQGNSLAALTSSFNNQYLASEVAVEIFDIGIEVTRGENASIVKYSEDEYGVWKYIGQEPDGTTRRSGELSSSANWIVYRYADVLLMKAEALSQLERFDEASLYINLIRERAEISLTDIPDNVIAFEDEILNQRRLEFAYEGKRWFDLLRLGRRNNFARKQSLIEIIVNNVPSIQKRILATKLSNPDGWYLPVHEEEIESNKNMVQNPYYDY